LSLLVCRRRGTASKPRATTMATNWPRNRIQTACEAGICTTAARYFAVASRQANSTQATHMRAIALSGWVTVAEVGEADRCISGDLKGGDAAERFTFLSG